ncbi:MAG: hypothetical protein JST70_08915 [Bacteroidetes bacterium]|nr:hypothetical protein [Bacteroidota bacterium]
MIWLELRTKNENYRSGWNLTESVWAPELKKNGARWPFYYLIKNVQEGDIIIHVIEDKSGKKYFEGFSEAATDGYTSSELPAIHQHDWDYSKKFYRADLKDHVEFKNKIYVEDFLSNNTDELTRYYNDNKYKSIKTRLFFDVKQTGRLHCLYGAYFSEFDSLIEYLISSKQPISNNDVSYNVSADEIYRTLLVRVGQQKFSKEVKKNFHFKCCYPNCEVTEDVFLVGSHISRWADNKAVRGDISNGLCLCLTHDKAFEKGFFIIDDKYRVTVRLDKLEKESWLYNTLIKGNDLEIKKRTIDPSIDSIYQHHERVAYKKKA